MTHTYTTQDVINLKDAVYNIRQCQERIEDDQKAYSFLDGLMNQIEEAIDEIEINIEKRA